MKIKDIRYTDDKYYIFAGEVMRTIPIFLLSYACRSTEEPKIVEPEEDIIVLDIDGDGYSEDQGDCDDNND